MPQSARHLLKFKFHSSNASFINFLVSNFSERFKRAMPATTPLK